MLTLQDVDGKLRDFQDKQNIDIGLIMGRGGGHQASLAPDSMPVIPRASGMRMGATRSLSVSKFCCFKLFSEQTIPVGKAKGVPPAYYVSGAL